MTERRWFGVGVRLVGLLLLVWSLEWVVSPIEAILTHLPDVRPADAIAKSWRIDLAAAAWRVAAGLFLMLRAGRVVAVAYPVGHGTCPACGYDCRATPDRCPECGADPVA